VGAIYHFTVMSQMERGAPEGVRIDAQLQGGTSVADVVAGLETIISGKVSSATHAISAVEESEVMADVIPRRTARITAFDAAGRPYRAHLTGIKPDADLGGAVAAMKAAQFMLPDSLTLATRLYIQPFDITNYPG
jgi:hypothetical protein